MLVLITLNIEHVSILQCVGQSGKCYASGQCCKGFVCAAFDDLFGKYLILNHNNMSTCRLSAFHIDLVVYESTSVISSTVYESTIAMPFRLQIK